MFETCEKCAENCADGEVDEAASALVCPNCGHLQFVRRLPAFIVTGASGTGKSTLARALALRSDRPAAVYLDTDMLLMKGLTEDGWPAYRNTWLWVAANIQQSGIPATLFGSASIADFENAPRRKLFTEIHYLALVCTDAELERRLRARPGWRQSSQEPFLTDQLRWNRSFREKAKPSEVAYDVLDTTDVSLEDTCTKIGEWLASRLRE